MTGIVLQMVLSGEINNCILSILYSKCCGRIFKGAAGVGIGDPAGFGKPVFFVEH